MKSELQLRAAVCEVGRRLWQRGLIGACEGNLSVRLSPQRLLCTPRGTSKGHLKPDDLCVIDLKGQPVGDSPAPSSEIKLHLVAYAVRPDCQAVVHAHPPVATAFTLAGETIPDNLLPEAGYVLGSVADVPFAFPGTEEVPEAIRPYLEDHKTFLLSHHGAVVLGRDIYDAYDRMETLERIATVIKHARELGATRPMPEAAFDRLLEVALSGRLD
ncbi:MAG: class II aldolase/adducin family protein [Fimbriimonadaceae bacterium]|nr:class II aldolase/adducin family protein [Fimbriimonadaceae bacterium]QYK55186.1 MAG: class II aldolase/adducin family protein [Fimbriimonadaceae bacterium]